MQKRLKNGVIIISGVLLFACGSDLSENPNGGLSSEETIDWLEQTSSVEENSDFAFDNFIVEYGNTDTISYIYECAEISIDSVMNGLQFTFNFNPMGCEDRFGNIHKGNVKVLVGTQGDHKIVKKTFTHYSFNNHGIEGTIDSNIYNNLEGQRTNERVADITITSQDSLYSNHRNSNYNIVLIEGQGDMILQNNVYSILGSATNQLSTGTNWSITNLAAIIRPGSCDFYAVSGQKSVVNMNNSSNSFFVDYGEGECDGIVEVTLPNGTVVERNQF